MRGRITFLNIKMQHQKHVILSKVIYKSNTISKWQLFIFCCRQADCKDHKEKKKKQRKRDRKTLKTEKGEETTLNNNKTPRSMRKGNRGVLT